MKTKILVILAAVIVSIGFIAVNLEGETFSGLIVTSLQDETIPALSLDGFTEVGISVEPEIIYLTSDCYVLSMVTTQFQTYSINTGLEEKIEFRPTSHDLIKDILENFDIEVLMIKINSFDQDAYFARLIVKQEDRILNLDSKPSDAIAVAVRTKSPVYIKQSILENNGENIC